jgi:hypothetical protein
MSYGITTKSIDGIPLGTVAVPGNTALQTLQGSRLNLTDANSNTLTGVVVSDALREAMLGGQAYRAHFEQTIGGAAQGFYGMALYNAAGSGKSILITAVRIWIKGNATLAFAFKDTNNPAMGNTATARNDDWGTSTASAVTVTYNTSSGGVSFPGTTEIATISKPSGETVVFQNERGVFVRMPSGTAYSLEVIAFIANSAQYGVQFEWSEY